eukprot:1186747-Prorocentrum_minimum.AAC.1
MISAASSVIIRLCWGFISHAALCCSSSPRGIRPFSELIERSTRCAVRTCWELRHRFDTTTLPYDRTVIGRRHCRVPKEGRQALRKLPAQVAVHPRVGLHTATKPLLGPFTAREFDATPNFSRAPKKRRTADESRPFYS